MPFQTPALSRRQLLKRASLITAAAVVARPAWAQPGKGASSRSIVVAQAVDFSQAQQDVSKDFLIGSRAAWQDINLRGGVRGRPVQHLALETDGTPASLRTALDSVKDNPSCMILSGSVGDQVASQIVALSVQGGLNIAHAAPWLQNSSLEIDDKTFPIFAARQEQIAYALKSLTAMGLKELGAIYATAQDYTAYHADVERIAAGMQLKLQPFKPRATCAHWARSSPPRHPPCCCLWAERRSLPSSRRAWKSSPASATSWPWPTSTCRPCCKWARDATRLSSPPSRCRWSMPPAGGPQLPRNAGPPL
jgi:hypothetical protein